MGSHFRKSGVRIPAPEGQKFFVLFSFHFQILQTKQGIFDFNHFLILLFRNQMKHVENVCKTRNKILMDGLLLSFVWRI